MDTDKLFDFIKVFFNEPKTYEDLTNHQKGRHQFMLNRFFSIQYPVQASNFNKLNTSSYGTAESWHLVALKFKRTPGFIFTKLNSETSCFIINSLVMLSTIFIKFGFSSSEKLMCILFTVSIKCLLTSAACHQLLLRARTKTNLQNFFGR